MSLNNLELLFLKIYQSSFIFYIFSYILEKSQAAPYLNYCTQQPHMNVALVRISIGPLYRLGVQIRRIQPSAAPFISKEQVLFAKSHQRHSGCCCVLTGECNINHTWGTSTATHPVAYKCCGLSGSVLKFPVSIFFDPHRRYWFRHNGSDEHRVE